MGRLVDVIVNKHFEVEPFISAMIAMHNIYHILPMPYEINVPSGVNRMDKPRAIYELKSIKVKVWCIEDLMSPEASGSNSKEKAKVLPAYIEKDEPGFVISVSTAESTPDVQLPKRKGSLNGSVLIGGNFFMFDARTYNPTQPSPSDLDVVAFQKDNLDSSFYRKISLIMGRTVDKFIRAINHPAAKMSCIPNMNYASIGVVNIVEYGGYTEGDPAAYKAFFKQKWGANYVPASIETTHGIVKMSVEEALPEKHVPTIFVSPITDRYHHFKDDVGDRGVQNYIAGYNAGIAVGKLLTLLDSGNKYFDWEPKNE